MDLFSVQFICFLRDFVFYNFTYEKECRRHKMEVNVDLDRLVTKCESELYLGFTYVESSGLTWLNVRTVSAFSLIKR